MNKALVPPANKAPGRPKAADLEARHQCLIQTAAQLFLKLGYGKVSLELIAREAHVAVRTIYVKFGGKSGLFQSVLIANRDRFITPNQMEADQRPFKVVIDEFGEHFYDMITAPEAMAVQRMVIAESKTNPEVATSFFEAGPRQTREMLARYFARPEVRAQMRDDVDLELLPSFLIQCIVGDPFSRFLFDPATQPREEMLRLMNKRIAMFYRCVLAQP